MTRLERIERAAADRELVRGVRFLVARGWLTKDQAATALEEGRAMERAWRAHCRGQAPELHSNVPAFLDWMLAWSAERGETLDRAELIEVAREIHQLLSTEAPNGDPSCAS